LVTEEKGFWKIKEEIYTTRGCFGPKITGLRAKKGGESELI